MKEIREINELKKQLRKRIWEGMTSKGLSLAPEGTIPIFSGQNKAAQRLRSLEEYKKAKTIMVAPDRTLLQVRINAIMDGKKLIMATPGLRDGFYQLHREMIRAKDWALAARSSAVQRYGKRLFTDHSEIGEVDLMVTGAVAVDLQGGRVGKGSGYFDIEYMILREVDSVKENTTICAIVDDYQVLQNVPMGPMDVAVDIICTPSKIIFASRNNFRPEGIFWHLLDTKQIKRMRPLRELSKRNKKIIF